jgi:hypothetical protein
MFLYTVFSFYPSIFLFSCLAHVLSAAEEQIYRLRVGVPPIQLAKAELPNAELLNAELPNAELPNVELLNAESYRTPNY